ncbi:MAG: ion transporter [Spirochaetes bacterium]|nr:ion transporter [Spirochaetota bacterium]MBN2769472.1 ion transporter [Spirochaetota bacterium]
MIKKILTESFSVSKKKGTPGWWINLFLICLIFLNAAAVVLESISAFYLQHICIFKIFEIFSITIFTIEYFLRLWISPILYSGTKATTARFKYSLTPMAIVDLLSVLPFYLPFVGADLRFVRSLRIMRLFRLFKIARYVKALHKIQDVLKDKKEELILSFVFVFFLLLFTSTLMYYVEHPYQPEKFKSIPESMWWSISTLTTVGYGDIYPISPEGKILGGFISLIGIAIFALPAGILASGFSESRDKKKRTKCPHCGKDIESTL